MATKGLHVASLPSLSRVTSIVDERPAAPGDLRRRHQRHLRLSCGTSSARRRASRCAVLVGLQSVGLIHMSDFVDAGLQISDARDATTLAEWIGAQLGLRKMAAAGQVTIAIAGAKGGIGKTLVVAMLAEGLKRRGLKVLIVDGDLSNSGLVPTFRIPSGFPSYLYLKQDGLGAFTPANVRRHVYTHEASGLHFLLGSEETANPMRPQRWASGRP